MKVVSIAGCNLASLAGEWKVDFSCEPFVSSPVFAISGPMGAGKSTLLDALCLALYRQTPRMLGNVDHGLVIGGFAKNDRKALLTRGEMAGYAEVVLLAQGKQWRFRWEVRKKKRSEGIEEDHHVWEMLADGSEVKQDMKRKPVAELIGLDFEQFTRSVLLAQGEFRKFLDASVKDRAAILETLSGADIYRRISKQVYERAQQEQQALAELQATGKGLVLLTEEERGQWQDSLLRLESLVQQGDLRLTALRQGVRWWSEYQGILVRCEKAKEELHLAQQKVEQGEEERQELGRIDEVLFLRVPYDALQKAKEQCSRLNEERKKLAEALQSLRTTQEEWSIALRTAQESLAQAERTLAEATPDLQAAVRLDGELQGLAAAVEHKDTAWKQAVKRVQEISLRQKQWEEQWATEKGIWDKAEASLVLLAPYGLLQQEWNEIGPALLDLDQKKQRLQQLSNDLKEKISQRQEAEDALEALRPLAQKALEDLSLRLRLHLRPGDPCPVCGSKQHDFVQSALAEGAVPNADQVLREQEELLRKRDGLASACQEKQRALEDEQSLWMQTGQGLQGRIEKMGIDAAMVLDSPLVLSRQWQGSLQAFENAQKARDGARQKCEAWEAQKESFAADLATAVAEKTACEDSLSQAQSLFAQGKENRQRLFAGRSVDEVRQALEKDVDKARKAMADCESRLAKCSQEMAERQGRQSTLLAEEKKIVESINEYKNILKNGCEPKGISAEELKRRLLVPPSQIQTMRSRQAECQATLERARATWQEREAQRLRQEELRNGLALPGEPDTWEAALQALDAELRPQREEWQKAKDTLAVDDRHREDLRQLQTQLEAKGSVVRKWQRLNDLLGSKDGDKFQRFAQGITMHHLCSRANWHLGRLSRRYSLEPVPGQELEFQIVDHDMGGECRSTKSLSGGESFLVSLALALGLSQMAARGTGIESLFIDEGFGSLDAATLQSVVGALEDLRQQGKTVGIISHVEGMARQFGAEIRVVRIGNGRSRIHV